MPAESRSAERQRPAGVGDDGAFQRLAAIAVPPLYRHGAVLAHAPQQVDFLVAETARLRADQGSEHGLWIAPCLKATAGQLDVDTYLELVDHTGQLLCGDKRGHIPAHLAPILERLHIDVATWLDVMRSRGRFLGSAVGAVIHLVSEATRRGLTWVIDTTGIHSDRRQRATPVTA